MYNMNGYKTVTVNSTQQKTWQAIEVLIDVENGAIFPEGDLTNQDARLNPGSSRRICTLKHDTSISSCQCEYKQNVML